jgi:pimeloyl-ACP methyl ester carboxylesterase
VGNGGAEAPRRFAFEYYSEYYYPRRLSWVKIMTILIAALIAGAQSLPLFVEKPCSNPQLAGKARCGTVEVLERRDDPASRRIALNVVIIPATSAKPDLPPLFDIVGGPGLASTENAGFYLTAGTAYTSRRDIVTTDQRGTGTSNGLICPELARPEDLYRPMFPAPAVASCRQRFAETADLTAYGTTEAARDLDDIRAALGHSKIDIFALSYGTTVALRYMSIFPERVRAAVLMGVAPPTAMLPRYHATAAERAFKLLFANCAEDESCRTAFPDPASDFDKALARLAKDGDLSPEVFAERLRSLAYSPARARQIPRILHSAAKGDMAPFFGATKGGDGLSYADGMYLSVVCSEGVALMDYDEARNQAKSTRFGDYRLQRQKEACGNWPIGKVAEDHLNPGSTSAAILMFSGRLDPVTPPEWADETARHLPNARNVMVPFGGHILNGLSGIDSCFEPMVLRFYETADSKTLDASCLASMKPPPFEVGNKAGSARN